MSTKIKLLEELRDQIQAGKFSASRHQSQFFEDVHGERVSVTSKEALEKINERIEQEKAE